MVRKAQKVLKYDEDDIKVLKNLEAVRAKRNFYIGPTDDHGLFTLAREAGDNSSDEGKAGRASQVYFRIFKSGRVEIHDDGQGMPVGIHKTEKISTLEVLVSQLHAGGKLTASAAYTETRGTHGIGIKATNALSKYFRVYTFRDKKWWTIAYAKGKKTQDVTEITTKQIKDVELVFKHGTVVVYEPDMDLFDKGSKLVPQMLLDWAEMAAYTAAGFKITVELEGKKPTVVEHNGGLSDWLESTIEELDCGVLTEKPIRIENKHMDLVLTFTDVSGIQVWPYTNGLYQSEGGSHLAGILNALFISLKPFMNTGQAKSKKDGGVSREDVAEGVVGLINFRIDNPKFSSQDKIKLTDNRFDELCLKDLTAGLEAYWSKNKGQAREILSRAKELTAAKAQFALSTAAKRELKDKRKDLGRLPTKLATVKCASDLREVFLIEGESAAGPARGARMTKPFRYQEALPLKGKPLNAFKDAKGKAMFSDEVQNILIAIGFDPDAKDPMARLRCGKIIMLSDPDPDGYHINCLILALLAKVVPGVFSRGMVYAVVSPKFMQTHNGTQYFGMTLEDLKGNLPKGVTMKATYLKGWGEISNVAAMRTIAFDPSTRQLIQIETPSKKEMNEFEALMGENVDYRRELLGIGG